MTRTQAIQLAQNRTEGRSKTLNMNLEFLNALQEFCLESRFYWRRKTVTFNTSANVPTYDLSSTLVTTSIANVSKGLVMADANGVSWLVFVGTDGILRQTPATTVNTVQAIGTGTGVDMEELIYAKYVKTSTNIVDLAKIFDHSAQEEIIEDATTGEPGSVFIEPGTSQTLRISPIPASTYKIRVSYWAVPNMDSEDANAETIPLVPAWQHKTVAKLLERNVLGFLFGEDSGKYVRADAEYQKQLQQAMAKRDGMVGKVVEWKSRENAIRST